MRRGYTILETVIYISMLAIIAMLVMGSILTMYRSYGKTKIERKIATNGEVALERIVREIRSATSTAAASVFRTNPGTLALSTGETFSIANGILKVQEGAGPLQNLTSSDVSVTSIIFYESASAHSTLIKIELAIESGGGVFQKTRVFYGSAVMRSGY